MTTRTTFSNTTFTNTNDRAFAHDRNGSISILTAFILPVLIAASAVVIDMGSAYLERRTAQSIVDLAAINAANNIEIAEAAAQATLDANKFGGIKALVVTRGHYTADPALAASARFKPGQLPYNAVHVELSKNARLYFARTFTNDPFEIRVAAVAGAANEATFSIGSRLAAVRDGLTNAILKELLQTNVELSVMDYNALAGAEVRVDDFLNAVSSELQLSAGTFSDVLDSTVTLNDLMAASATVTEANGNPAVTALLKLLQGSSPSSLVVPLRTLIDIGPYADFALGQRTAGLEGTISVLDVLRSSAIIANGQHQIALNLDLGLPGIAALKLDLAIGERKQTSPWIAVGQHGARVSTAQLKLRLIADVLGTGLLDTVSIKVPIYLELAYADATLSDVSCGGSDDTKTATVSVRPGIGRAAIADVNDTDLLDPALRTSLRKAKIIATPLLSVHAQAIVDLGNLNPSDLKFSQADVDNNVIKRAHTTDFVGSLVTSLVQQTKFEIGGGGLLALPGLSSDLVRTVLLPVTSTLDKVVSDILETVGVSLGEADVSVHGIRCGDSNLSG